MGTQRRRRRRRRLDVAQRPDGSLCQDARQTTRCRASRHRDPREEPCDRSHGHKPASTPRIPPNTSTSYPAATSWPTCGDAWTRPRPSSVTSPRTACPDPQNGGVDGQADTPPHQRRRGVYVYRASAFAATTSPTPLVRPGCRRRALRRRQPVTHESARRVRHRQASDAVVVRGPPDRGADRVGIANENPMTSAPPPSTSPATNSRPRQHPYQLPGLTGTYRRMPARGCGQPALRVVVGPRVVHFGHVLLGPIFEVAERFEQGIAERGEP